MTSITSPVPALSSAYIWHLVFNYMTVPVLLVQGALLHPYYEPDPFARKIRAWLAPLIIWLVIHSQKSRLFHPMSDYVHINYCLVAIPTFHIICITLQYASHRGPARKVDALKLKKEESEPSSDSDSDHSSSITNSDSQSPSTTVLRPLKLSKKKESISKRLKEPKVEPTPSIGELARFSMWMTCSPRSLDFVWAAPEHVLAPGPKISVARFLGREIFKLVVNQLALIVYCAVALPSTSNSAGIYGWLKQYIELPDNRLVRFVCDRALMLPWGSVGLHAFSLVGNLFTLLELTCIIGARWVLPSSSGWRPEPFDPTRYPDLFSRPMLRTSLSDFWAKGWQSVFRRDFVFCGAEPLAKLFSPFGIFASRLAGLMGAMLMSGLLHEWGLISCGERIDWSFRTTQFFLICGVGITLETLFKKLTGRRVRGVLGWIWLWTWLAYWCETFMDVWFDRGVGLAGMHGSLEVHQWQLAKFLVPLGPLLPDEVLSKFSTIFSQIFSMLGST